MMNHLKKTLSEARGYVISEYQEYLEKKMDSRFRSKISCKIE